MTPLALLFTWVLRVYRWIGSPLKGVVFGPAGRCRYAPTCSEYALEAVRRHGALRGAWLSAGRLSRCHPWGGAGFDPVPGCGCGSHTPDGASGLTAGSSAVPRSH